ncbi:hypothetical protein JK635_07975 [Neobacillus sp. YIM B02564]|uniref:Uncharacterized protein n=1 Tax=Neobacillus paridis TaxID=2803862 RepID=A0ABS1TLG6_9BACI|nr:hypothetical protein [Neobacillus paridis]MBL4952148.1 hypothetical protein [Neobacillus paridis]
MLFDFLPEDQQIQMRTHLSSYLKWVHTHNPEFQNNLTTEELTTCWLEDCKHPKWMMEKIHDMNLLFIVHVNEYLERYKDQAYLFEEEVTPEFLPPKNQAAASNQKTNYDAATPKQIKFLLYLTKKHNRTNINLQHITKKEASKLISELLALQ